MNTKKDRILLVLWVTGRCNLKCVYCYADGNPFKQDMDREVMLETLHFFKDYPLKIQFAGGEPMMNFPLIQETCRQARAMGLDATFQMQTNGTMIGEEQAREIRKMGIALGISLDGIPSVNEIVRGRTADVVRGIQALKAEGVRICLNSVVTARNVQHLSKLVDFAVYLDNVDGIGLDLLRSSGRGKSAYGELQVRGEDLTEALTRMYDRSMELYRLTGKRIVIREVEEAAMRLKTSRRPSGYCYASCGRSYVVLPEGSVYPCGSLVGKPEFYMGKIGETIKPFCLKTAAGSKCPTCEFETVCPGGCPSRMLLNGFDDDGIHLDCTLKKTAFKLAEGEGLS